MKSSNTNLTTLHCKFCGKEIPQPTTVLIDERDGRIIEPTGGYCNYWHFEAHRITYPFPEEVRKSVVKDAFGE